MSGMIANSQVTTPKGKNVPVRIVNNPSTGLPDYNCHSYAFYKSEGGSGNYWMEIDGSSGGYRGSVRYYLDGVDGDKSYRKVTGTSIKYADKVIYQKDHAIIDGGGHSANFEPNPSNSSQQWRSKNGNDILRYHTISHPNYGSSDVTYYAKCSGAIKWGNTNINGPSTLTSQKTYTMPGLMKNKKITNITVSNQHLFSSITIASDKSYVKLTPKSGVNGTAVIKFYLKNGCPVEYRGKTISKTISVDGGGCGGTSVNGITISGPSSVCLNTPFYLSASARSGLQYNWNTVNGQVLYQNSNGDFIRMEQFYNSVYVILTVTNQCGQSKTITKAIPIGSYCIGGGYYLSANINEFSKLLEIDEAEVLVEGDISLYPNPASSMINVKSREEIDLITIINSSGGKVLKTKENIIDVSTLSNGLYLVKIQIGEKEVIKKLIKK